MARRRAYSRSPRLSCAAALQWPARQRALCAPGTCPCQPRRAMRLRSGAPAGGMGSARTAAGPAVDTYGTALIDMVEGITRQGPEAYSKAAASMERLAEAGSLPAGVAFYASLHSALCYDISGCPSGAVRMYEKAGQRYGGEFDHIVQSGRHARGIAEGLAALGRDGDVSRLSGALDETIGLIKRREKEAGGPLRHDSPDDYNVFMSSVILVDDFFKAASEPAGAEKVREIARDAGKRAAELRIFRASPLLHFTAMLYLRLIMASCERPASRPG